MKPNDRVRFRNQTNDDIHGECTVVNVRGHVLTLEDEYGDVIKARVNMVKRIDEENHGP